MKQLQRYLFWWICGAVLVVELVLIAMFSPSADDKSPEEVKLELNAKYKDLSALHARANNPMRSVYDAEEKVSIDQLTKDYLITEKWETVLKPAVEKYQQQLDGIAADLVERSKVLRETVLDTTDNYAWQLKYLDQTESLLQKLEDAGQLVIPEKAAGNGKAAAAEEGNRFRENKDIRKIAGFETPSGSQTFPTERHPDLTAKLRIVGQVVAALTRTEAQALPNPVVNHGLTALPAQKPRLVDITWTPQSAPFKGTFEKRIAGAYLATIRLEGAESALIAAVAALEQLEKPVAVVTAVSLKGPDAPPGKRIGGPDLVLPAQATVDLLVLDMAKETK